MPQIPLIDLWVALVIQPDFVKVTIIMLLLLFYGVPAPLFVLLGIMFSGTEEANISPPSCASSSLNV